MMKRRSIQVVLWMGSMVLLAGCNAASSTPIDTTDPLAAVCAGLNSAESLQSTRDFFGKLQSDGVPVEGAQAEAKAQCDTVADPAADFDACLACLNAVVAETYGAQ